MAAALGGVCGQNGGMTALRGGVKREIPYYRHDSSGRGRGKEGFCARDKEVFLGFLTSYGIPVVSFPATWNLFMTQEVFTASIPAHAETPVGYDPTEESGGGTEAGNEEMITKILLVVTLLDRVSRTSADEGVLDAMHRYEQTKALPKAPEFFPNAAEGTGEVPIIQSDPDPRAGFPFPVYATPHTELMSTTKYNPYYAPSVPVNKPPKPDPKIFGKLKVGNRSTPHGDFRAAVII
eukprot:jgi/Bigna1/74628/fgenesh1_pg.30_\